MKTKEIGKKLPLFLAVFFAFVAVSTLFLSSQAIAVEKIKLTGHMPVGHHCTLAMEEVFIPKVEEYTDGALKIEYYPAGQLAMDKKALELLEKGALEMAQFFDNRAVGQIPEVDLMWPWFDQENWWARRLWDEESGGGMYQKLIAPKFRDRNVIPLIPSIMYYPEHSIITKEPVKSLEDYDGMKIRVSGKSAANVVEALGAQPVVMSSADVYMALQRGTIDGANSGLTSFISRKWFEIAKHIQSHTWESPSCLSTMVNKEWWDELPREHKEAIFKANKDAARWSWEYGFEAVKKDTEFLKENGVEFYEWSPEETEILNEKGYEAVAEEVGELVSDKAWEVHENTYQATKNKDKTWEEVFDSLTLDDIVD